MGPLLAHAVYHILVSHWLKFFQTRNHSPVVLVNLSAADFEHNVEISLVCISTSVKEFTSVESGQASCYQKSILLSPGPFNYETD
jgi:hypothetical protein